MITLTSLKGHIGCCWVGKKRERQKRQIKAFNSIVTSGLRQSWPAFSPETFTVSIFQFSSSFNILFFSTCGTWFFIARNDLEELFNCSPPYMGLGNSISTTLMWSDISPFLSLFLSHICSTMNRITDSLDTGLFPRESWALINSSD